MPVNPLAHARYVASHRLVDKVRHSDTHLRALDWLERIGPKACLLSWLPAIGDPLCAVAGWLRLAPPRGQGPPFRHPPARTGLAGTHRPQGLPAELAEARI
ncbi:hypothetical protein [Mycobacterium tuberculosis]|uniref:hypothetical protein n=1 Tax=Mycobacterium tuberculosis TaxID=1773 RepID=UPI00272D4DE0|nr:hypothetical protein [Mycobacterium tuberculosis]